MAENQPGDVLMNEAPPQGGTSRMLIIIAVILLVAIIPVAVLAVKNQQDTRSRAQEASPTATPSGPTPKPTPDVNATPQPSCTPISTNLNVRITCPTCQGQLYEPVP